MDWYLCDMLPDALRDVANLRGPAKLTDEQWHRRIECMATGFEAMRCIISRDGKEHEAQLERRFRRGWKLMGKWFEWL